DRRPAPGRDRRHVVGRRRGARLRAARRRERPRGGEGPAPRARLRARREAAPDGGGEERPLKPTLGILAVAAIALVAVSASSRPWAAPAVAKQRETVLYGHVKSLTRKGSRYELRFDPAWWLTGYTAQ